MTGTRIAHRTPHKQTDLGTEALDLISALLVKIAAGW